MWWLDDSRFRGRAREERRILFRAGVPVSAKAGTSSRKRRRLNLSEAQKAANQSLLEVGSEHELETESLRADMASLERAVRDQASRRVNLETELKQAAARHAHQIAELKSASLSSLDQLRGQHNLESEDLRGRLARAEQRATEQACQLAEYAEHNERLRESLLSAEQKVRQRDAELDELQSEAELQEQQLANQLAETLHRHAAESKHLQGIASAADQRAADRKREIDKLKMELSQLAGARGDEVESLTKKHEANVKQVMSELYEAHEQINVLASELASHKRHLKRLTDKNERYKREASTAASEIESAALNLEQREKEHASEVANLTSEIGQLYAELDRRAEEQALLDANASETIAEQSSTIADLNQQLQTMQERLRQLDATAAARQQQVVELRDAVNKWKKKANESSADRRIERRAREERIIRLQQSLQREQDAAVANAKKAKEVECELRATCDELRKGLEKTVEESSRALQQQRQQIADLKESLTLRGDDRQSQSNQAQRKLQAECDALKSELKHALEESRTSHELQCNEIDKLKNAVEQRDNELQSLWHESEQLRREVDQRNGALERMKLKSEQLMEMHDTQFVTLQSRIDELTVALDSERRKCSTAENEARRLSVSRSQRIAFLEQKRGQLASDLGQLRQQEARLREVVANTECSLREAEERIRRQSDQIEKLRGEVDAGAAREAEIRKNASLNLQAAQKETARLVAKLNEAEEQLRQQQAQLDAPPPISSENLNFAIAQRDRTIALLEQEAIVMQERLQREAAARRKAEGAMKRRADSGRLDPAAHETWSQIDAHDQIQRLQRQANALRNINLLERQRALAEISRYKKEIERLKPGSAKRAA